MFKRTCVIIFSLILVFSFLIFNNVPVFSNYSSHYEVYTTDSSNISAIKKVNKSEYFLSLSVKGESCMIDKQKFCLKIFLSELKAKQIFCEQIGEMIIYYAYSPQIKYLEQVNGKLINLQIAVAKDYVKVGSPLIYGSF